MMTSNRKGILLVVSGPAGVGKGTVCQYVAKVCPEIFLSISATSRIPRTGEADGIHYYYKTKDEFEAMIQNNELLEYNRYVNGNYYGTPAEPCDEHINRGESIILEIDVEGGRQVKQKRPETIMVFVVPPSFEELERRLRGRGTETEDDIIARLKRARAEFELAKTYDYIVVNDTVENAAEKIIAIAEAEKCRTFRCIDEIKEKVNLK